MGCVATTALQLDTASRAPPRLGERQRLACPSQFSALIQCSAARLDWSETSCCRLAMAAGACQALHASCKDSSSLLIYMLHEGVRRQLAVRLAGLLPGTRLVGCQRCHSSADSLRRSWGVVQAAWPKRCCMTSSSTDAAHKPAHLPHEGVWRQLVVGLAGLLPGVCLIGRQRQAAQQHSAQRLLRTALVPSKLLTRQDGCAAP